MSETLHEAFIRGFGKALGLSEATEIEIHYSAWLDDIGVSVVEAADIETEGYEAGYDAGRDYLENSNQ